MREIYLVSGIYEDDFGCEERPADYKPLVAVTLRTRGGNELTMKQPDAWMYEQNIREGDTVILAAGRLVKAETPGKRIFCFGDSNTYGYDPRSVFGGRLPKSQRWTDVLQDLSGWEILNRGANGRTIPQETWALEKFDRQLAECGPVDLVLIMLGINDLLNHFRPDMGKVSERMEQFIGHVLSHPVIGGKPDQIFAEQLWKLLK